MTRALQSFCSATKVAAIFALVTGAGVLSFGADTTSSAGSPKTFSSPEDAVKALVAATQAVDHATVNAIFGAQVKDMLSGDAKQDALEFTAFAKSLGQYHQLVKKADDRYVLDLGDQNWPFPIPLVKHGSSWSFDTAAGKEEIINRRIGEDEAAAIGVCRTYLEAQREYANEDRSGDGVFKYAQKIRSSANQKDGLYWPVTGEEEASPFGPLIAEIHAEGYGGKTPEGKPEPFHGYHFKILTAQGASAPGGAFSYVINGNMIAGFALVAFPAHWGESGVMTFIVNQWGKVYERNLGPESAEIAAEMTEFDPDKDWTVVTWQ